MALGMHLLRIGSLLVKAINNGLHVVNVTVFRGSVNMGQYETSTERSGRRNRGQELEEVTLLN
jgi:hypothetical protein